MVYDDAEIMPTQRHIGFDPLQELMEYTYKSSAIFILFINRSVEFIPFEKERNSGDDLFFLLSNKKEWQKFERGEMRVGKWINIRRDTFWCSQCVFTPHLFYISLFFPYRPNAMPLRP